MALEGRGRRSQGTASFLHSAVRAISLDLFACSSAHQHSAPNHSLAPTAAALMARQLSPPCSGAGTRGRPEARGCPDAQAQPNPRSLGDVASWSVGQLVKPDWEKLAVSLPERLRLGTACSGSDCPVISLEHLAAALRLRLPAGRTLHVDHVFSCESDKAKQRFIRENFPQLRMLFDDVTELGNGRATNVLTETQEEVPRCDIFVAGFVCKSVSMENPNRDDFAGCVTAGVGKTGETWMGVLRYILFAKPAVVICENVEGLTKRTRGIEPQIEPVMRSLQSAGYQASWRLLDSRNFHLPHRRKRCWIWAFRNAGQDVADRLMPETLRTLMSPRAGLSCAASTSCPSLLAPGTPSQP